jgi:hypothetical protein
MEKMSGCIRTRHIKEGGLNVERLIAWPPRLADLTPVDLFLWGHAKKYVYADTRMTIEDLVAILHVAVTMVDANMLRRVRENAVRRTAVCHQMDGGGFQHLL